MDQIRLVSNEKPLVRFDALARKLRNSFKEAPADIQEDLIIAMDHVVNYIAMRVADAKANEWS